MSFDELLDRCWFFDSEVFSHDMLFVFKSYKTNERVYFHNSPAQDLQNFIDLNNPILIGYNCNGYDKWILKCWLAGYTPEEMKQVNDYIIAGGKGWEIDCGYIKLPTMWDLMPCIIPRKSLKELEGSLRLNITETTVPFDLPTRLTKEQFNEVLYYCTCDVDALIPIFKMLIDRYKSKYIIANLGKMNPEYALSLTDANLTAELLGGKRIEHDDNFCYTYPKEIQKEKIPKKVLDYFDDIIEHNDLEYDREGPVLNINDCIIKLQLGGLHGAKNTTFIYNEGVDFKCD